MKMQTSQAWALLILVLLPVFLNVSAVGEDEAEVEFTVYQGKANVHKIYQLGEHKRSGFHGSVRSANEKKVKKILYFIPYKAVTMPTVALKVLLTLVGEAELKLEYEISEKLHNGGRNPRIGVVNGYGLMTEEGVKVAASEMEMIPGENFDAYIKAHAGDSDDQKRYIALKFVERMFPTLREIHRKGVVHKDLKPANLMVKVDSGNILRRPDDFVLIDFGNASNETGEVEVNGNEDFVQVVVVFYMVLTGIKQDDIPLPELAHALDTIMGDQSASPDAELLVFLQQLLCETLDKNKPRLSTASFGRCTTEYRKFLAEYTRRVGARSSTSVF